MHIRRSASLSASSRAISGSVAAAARTSNCIGATCGPTSLLSTPLAAALTVGVTPVEVKGLLESADLIVCQVNVDRGRGDSIKAPSPDASVLASTYAYG